MLKRIGKTRKWSRRKIISELKKIHQRGEPLNHAYLKKNYLSLWAAINNNKLYFTGGFKEATEAAGFDYEQIRLVPPPWNLRGWLETLDEKGMEELRQRIERLEGGEQNEQIKR